MSAGTSLFSDPLLAQLMEMGFDPELVTACQMAMSSSNTPLTLQSATEWILQSMAGNKTDPVPIPQSITQPTTTPTLKLGGSSQEQQKDEKEEEKVEEMAVTPTAAPASISRPMSSGSALTYSEPLTSRYDLSDEKRKQKEQFISKERDDAIKQARERRMNEMRAKAAVMKQIEEDKQRRAERAAQSKVKTAATSSGGSVQPQQQMPAAAKPNPSGQCRVQIRLPNGSVLRHSFPSETTLAAVSQHISQNHPHFVNVQLIQPFPHKEFSPEEYQQSLQTLNLCPSASLVVKSPSPRTDQSNKMEVSKPVQDKMEVSEPVQVPVAAPAQEDPEDMEEDDSVSNPVGILPYPRPPPGRLPPSGRLPPNPGGFPGGLPPGVIPAGPVMRGGVPLGGMAPQGHHHQGPRMVFAGEGHRLGGREAPMKFGDPQSMSKYVTDTARDAAEKRNQVLSKATENQVQRVFLDVPKLDTLCLRTLARWSSVDSLPSCSHLPPIVAQKLLMGLAEAKQLHPKTLNVFLKCPIQSLVLDNYCYATNHLIDMFKYFPTLTHLSLVSCNLITDKSMMQLLPYLPQLVLLNLNDCSQLSDDIFQNFRGFDTITVLRLSFLNISDTGMMYLLRRPLPRLQELDISLTNISECLPRLGQQSPNLRILNIESTLVTDITSLVTLKYLHTLMMSRCSLVEDISPLAKCDSLTSLSLADVSVNIRQLQLLASLHLTTFVLPDRNEFYDKHMTVIAEYPLSSLNLTGYCHVTDVGISHISRMRECLTQLSLSRTRLTDEGMVYLEGLVNLKQLTLDNTIITDNGIMSICGLHNLEDLSLSDTKLTSQFILDGALTKLTKLSKLNLVRTFIDDAGLLNLCLPSLMMLNIDWTCATPNVTIEVLREKGCRSLETFRNKNIEQPSPAAAAQRQQVQPMNRQQALAQIDMFDRQLLEDDYSSDEND